jgi:hypothetical protein
MHLKRNWQTGLIILAVLIVGVLLAVPARAGAPPPDRAKAPSTSTTSPDAYYLLGEYNNVSYNTNYFTGYGGNLNGNWWFQTGQTNSTAVRGYCPYGSACYGVWGDGNGIGVVGTGYSWGTYGGGNQYGTYSTSAHGYAAYNVCDYSDCWSSVTNYRAWVASNMYAYNYYYHSLAPDGTERAVPMSASTQSVISDEGGAQLVNGRAVVTFGADYASTVDVASSDYRVFVTPNSADTAGLAVVNKTANSFEVRELNKGTGNFSFDWRVDAVRKGEEGNRMTVITNAPQIDGLGPNRNDLPILNKINERQQHQPEMPVQK